VRGILCARQERLIYIHDLIPTCIKIDRRKKILARLREREWGRREAAGRVRALG
jgi:hypothetical protein